MTQLNRHKLVRAIYDATMAVEVCGASPELTHACNMVNALYPQADALLDERDKAGARIAELEAALRDLIETTPNSDAREWVAARAVVAAAGAPDGGRP